MKPFNLDDAKAGKPLITRDGRSARFIAHVPEANPDVSLIVQIVKRSCPLILTERGTTNWEEDAPSDYDIFMAPVKVTRWVNFYADGAARHYETKIDAATATQDLTIPVYSEIIAIAVPVEIEQ